MIKQCLRNVRVTDVPPLIARDIITAVRMENRRDERDRRAYLCIVARLRNVITTLQQHRP